jgi:hypothetical protein
MVVFLNVELREIRIQPPSRGLQSLPIPMDQEYNFGVYINVRL